jgi:ABC-type xylose transport system permease subunit
MATTYNLGLPMPAAMALCLVVSTTFGLVNGLLMTRFRELSSVIVTLATMIIYRGIAYMILENRAAGKFPEWFSWLGWGNVGKLPFIAVAFAACAVVFTVMLHGTAFGRKVYGMGNNLLAMQYSGIRTDSIIIITSVLTGLMAGFKAGIEEQKFEAILRAPDQPMAEAQIQIIEQLIARKVASICIVGNDFDALQPVLRKATAAGIKVFSLDSSVNPAARPTHINQTKALDDRAVREANPDGFFYN